MKRLWFGFFSFTVMILLLYSTLGSAQVQSAVETNAAEGDYVTYKITTKMLAEQTPRVDYLRFSVDKIDDLGTYVIITGRFWAADESTVKKDAQNLNKTEYLVASGKQIAMITDEPPLDLIQRLNYIWKKDSKIDDDTFTQLQNYVKKMSTTQYPADIYGTVEKVIERTDSNYGYKLTFKNSSASFMTLKKVFSNSGFLTYFENATSENEYVKYEIQTDLTNAIITLEELSVTLPITYGVAIGGGILAGVIVQKIAEKRRPKISTEV